MYLHCSLRFVGLLAIGLGVVYCAQPSKCGTAAGADNDTDASMRQIQRYEATKSSDNYRVTLLSITNGVAFLASPGLVSDEGRAHGNNAVPWIRVTVMIEQLGKKDARRLGSRDVPFHFLAETADGRRLVDRIGVPSDGTLFPNMYQKYAAFDVNSSHLVPLFPTAPPQTADPEHAVFFVLHLSGNVRKTEAATFRFGFGTGPEHDEVTFENVPIP